MFDFEELPDEPFPACGSATAVPSSGADTKPRPARGQPTAGDTEACRHATGQLVFGQEGEEDEQRLNVTRAGCLWDVGSVTAWRRLRGMGHFGLPRLCQLALDAYRGCGVVGPMRALSEAELRDCREGLARFMGDSGGFLANDMTVNNHVTLPWLYELARHPRIVGAVASVLGTDGVMLFSSCIFLREPQTSCESAHGVGWHEDGHLYSRVLEPMKDWVTAFVALTPCQRENGCLHFVPKIYRPSATLNRVDPPSHAMELMPGEFSLHTSTVTHRGGRNSSRQRRDCIALRYISCRVRDKVVEEGGSGVQRDWVIPCGGTESTTLTHFQPLPPPVQELGVDERRRMAALQDLRKRRYGTTVFDRRER